MTKARFVGGPLAGQEYMPRTKWSRYLTEEGKTMPAQQGDRIFGRDMVEGAHRLVRVYAGYVLREQQGQRIYVHSSVVSCERLAGR